MSLVFKGYKIKGTDLNALEDVLSKIQKQVELRAKRIYHELLAKEIELLVDDIAIGLLKRPEHMSIYDICVEELNKKVSWASGNGVLTLYNLNVQAAAFIYKNNTYIKLSIPNARLLKELKRIDGASAFDFNDNEDPSNSALAATWEEIMQIYSDGNYPFVRQVYPIGPIEVTWKNVATHFHSPSERQEMRIRHVLTNELMNLIGMKQQIPDNRLMPYFDDALMMLSLPEVKAEAERRKMNTAAVFVNITEEMVKLNPADDMPLNFNAYEPS